MSKQVTQKQKSKRVGMEVRRYKALELKVKGFSDRAIARELGVGVATAHGDVKKVLDKWRSIKKVVFHLIIFRSNPYKNWTPSTSYSDYYEL